MLLFYRENGEKKMNIKTSMACPRSADVRLPCGLSLGIGLSFRKIIRMIIYCPIYFNFWWLSSGLDCQNINY